MRKTAFLLTIGGGVALATAWWLQAQQESAAAKPPRPVSHRVDFLDEDPFPNPGDDPQYRIRSDGLYSCPGIDPDSGLPCGPEGSHPYNGSWDYWHFELDTECLGCGEGVSTGGATGSFASMVAREVASRAVVFDWAEPVDPPPDWEVPDLDWEMYCNNDPYCFDPGPKLDCVPPCVPWEIDPSPLTTDRLAIRFHGGKPGLFHKKTTRYPLYINFGTPRGGGGWAGWYRVEFVEAPYVVKVDADTRILTTKNPDTGVHDAALVDLLYVRDGNPGTYMGSYELPFEAIFKLVYH